MPDRTAEDETWINVYELGWAVLPQPPYSSNNSAIDFHLFRNVKHFLREKKNQNLDDIQNAISRYFAQQPTDF